MKRNIGSLDRTLRILAGVAILGAGLFYQSWLGLLGLIPLFTAFSGWCPLYSLIGVSTRGKDESGEEQDRTADNH